jgi:hypothetical protein
MSRAPSPIRTPAPAYRAELLPGARVDERGVRYQRGDASELLAWDGVTRAFAAEVGEPEGVSTVVFDLIVGRDGATWLARRLDAEPAEAAVAVARAITLALGPERVAASLKSLAAEGAASRWYPDLESFEASVLAALAGS